MEKLLGKQLKEILILKQRMRKNEYFGSKLLKGIKKQLRSFRKTRNELDKKRKHYTKAIEKHKLKIELLYF